MAQVRNLRPGRRYAYRLGIHVEVMPPLSAPPEQAPSPEVVFETPATQPEAPAPPQTTRNERTALMVGPAAALAPRSASLITLHATIPTCNFAWGDRPDNSQLFLGTQ